jgi:hypothetical protein
LAALACFLVAVGWGFQRPASGAEAGGAAAVVPPAAVSTSSEVNLIGFGDWGMVTPERQKVADLMASVAAKASPPFDAALGLGDNFYVPVSGIDDPVFANFFENAYDAKRMNFPFYFVAGNHDYESTDGVRRYEWEMKYAAAHPTGRWKQPARWYRLDLPAGKPLVTILMIDSDKENTGKQASLTPVEWKLEKTWIEAQLAGPRAPWTMACAHHTIYSDGAHGDNGVLQQEWGTLFEKYHVDFYQCGHDHCLQHIEVPGKFTSFVVSGGGGAKVYPLLRDDHGPFFRSVTGFVTMHFTPDKATVKFYAVTGLVMHTFERDRASGKVTVTQTTPNDARTPYPLRLIQGFYDRVKRAPATPAAPAATPATQPIAPTP